MKTYKLLFAAIALVTFVCASAQEVPFQREKGSGEWWENGTMHKVTAAQWPRGTEANKLATCSDFVTHLNKNETGSYKMDMNELLSRSVSLRACISEAAKGADPDTKISQIAAACAIALGWY